MIEEYRQKRDEYCAERDEMIRNGSYGTALQIVNTKIQMCGGFIACLQRCRQQETELEEENRRIQAEEAQQQ
jgi:hypothetical protein